MKTLKKIPKFKSEKEERAFWSEHDAAEYVDFTGGKKISLPNLKPSTKTISIRLPEFLLERLKQIANKQDIPYQSLIKMYLAERTEAESKKG